MEKELLGQASHLPSFRVSDRSLSQGNKVEMDRAEYPASSSMHAQVHCTSQIHTIPQHTHTILNSFSTLGIGG